MGELLHTRWCWASTSASSGWAKMERTKVATMVWVDLGTWVSRLRRKCTRQRGREVPGRVAASAALSPKWSSEISQLHPGQPPLWAITRDAKFSTGRQAYVKA